MKSRPLLVGQTAADDNARYHKPNVKAVLDRNQRYLGKSFITLRQHKETLSELDEVVDGAASGDSQLEQAVKGAFGAGRVTGSA